MPKMIGGRITPVIKNLDVELTSRSKTALTDISAGVINMCIFYLRRISDVRNIIIDHLYRSNFTFIGRQIKSLSLYICAVQRLPLQISLGQFRIRRLLGLDSHCLDSSSPILRLLRSRNIRQSVTFSTVLSLGSCEGDAHVCLIQFIFAFHPFLLSSDLVSTWLLLFMLSSS